MRILEVATKQVERAAVLDGVADAVHRKVAPLLGTPAARKVLGGEWLGHPVHPILVTVPIGSWTSALVLDLMRVDADAARRLIALGVVSAAPTAWAGWSDWTETQGAARRVGLVHAVSNFAAVGAFVASYAVRRGGNRGRGTAYALGGATAMSVGGYLGGHLSYRLGVGVDVAPASDTDVEV